MAIAFRAQSAIAIGSTSVSPALPAGTASGDIVAIFVTTKPDTATINVPANWTLQVDVAGGGGTNGNGTGPTRGAWLTRQYDGVWTMPAVSITSGNSSAAIAIAYSKGASTAWAFGAASAAYGTAATVTAVSAAMGTNPGITSNDFVLFGVTSQDDAPTWSAQAYTATGISAAGTMTERSDVIETITGNDVGGMVAQFANPTGTSTAAPTFTATASAATRGTIAMLRLREVAVAVTGTADGSFGFAGSANGTVTTPPTGGPPTRVLRAVPSSGNWSNNTTPKTTTSFDVQAGDLIVVKAANEGGPLSSPSGVTPSASGGSVTWDVSRVTGGAVGEYRNGGYVWWGVVGADATGITVTLAQPSSSASSWGFAVTVWRNHGGIGSTFTATNGGVVTPEVSFTASDDSAVDGLITDWWGSDPSGRTWSSINGTAITEAQHSATGLYVYDGYHPGMGAAGSKTFGLTAPNMRYTITGVEILAGEGAGGSVSGTASGSFGFTATAFAVPRTPGSTNDSFGFVAQVIGKPRKLGSATASFGFTSSTQGASRALGTVIGSFGFVGTVNGTVTAPPGVGQAQGSFGFVATVVGQPRTRGVASGSFGFSTSTQGIPETFGLGQTSFGFVATASGKPRHLGQASASFGFTTSSSGIPETFGVTQGSFGFVATASGKVKRFGEVAGVFGFVATVSGEAIEQGTLDALFGFSGNANGQVRHLGEAVANFGGSFIAQGSGQVTVVFFASGGIFLPVQTLRAQSGVWVDFNQTMLSV